MTEDNVGDSFLTDNQGRHIISIHFWSHFKYPLSVYIYMCVTLLLDVKGTEKEQFISPHKTDN